MSGTLARATLRLYVDNGANYRAKAFRRTVLSLAARHQRAALAGAPRWP